jgi:hypothetical protein
MKPISLVRFDALAGYARSAYIRFLIDELSWFEHAEGRVLGMTFRDRTDSDFGGMVFGQDRLGRYRWIGATPEYYPSNRRAEAHLRQEMERLAHQPDEEYYQGDEEGSPIDFFAALPGNKVLNTGFIALSDDEAFSAARGIVEPMMRWYDDVDGNFIEQFQTGGFDARIWELYLFAAFREMGFDITRDEPAPDFYCANPLAEFYVEALTLNPSIAADGTTASVPRDNTEEFVDYLHNYMPTRFASGLTTKLAKRYWEQAHVTGKPLVFAVQDFSAPGSMSFTRSAFENYITGYTQTATRDKAGKLIITPKKIGSHHWGQKTIPSGFFELPESENVSAVLFSNSGTIAKFNRMGVLAGFGSDRVKLFRVGYAVDHDPNASAPVEFRHDVRDPGYSESWSEGIDIWHNPHALHPLDPRSFPGVAHHRLLPDGQVVSVTPRWHPLGSTTLHMLPKP